MVVGGAYQIVRVVGEGAFVDRAFNTTDVFLLMDTAAMSERHRKFYQDRWQGA